VVIILSDQYLLTLPASVSKRVRGTFREECRLRMFEDRVLRRILAPKRDKVTGE